MTPLRVPRKSRKGEKESETRLLDASRQKQTQRQNQGGATGRGGRILVWSLMAFNYFSLKVNCFNGLEGRNKKEAKRDWGVQILKSLKIGWNSCF